MPKGEIKKENLDVQLVRAGDHPIGFKSRSSKDRIQIFFDCGVPELGCVACEELLVWHPPHWRCPSCEYTVTSSEALEIVGQAETRLKQLKDAIGRSGGQGSGRWSLAKLFGR